MRRDLTRAQLIGIVDELRQLDLPPERRREQFALLEANVPCPGDMLEALVYGSDFEYVEPEGSAAEAVDLALAYTPLVTPPPAR
jgi:hypothetical protein